MQVQRPIYDEAIPWLVARVPELQSLYSEHVADFDEVLPYLAFEGDFMNWLGEQDPASEPVHRFLAAVEAFLTVERGDPRDDELWILTTIGFVDNLAAGINGDDELLEAIRPHLGPVTASAVDAEQRRAATDAHLRDYWTRCRCDELSEVQDVPANWYSEHMVWIDGPLMGDGGQYRCPATGALWTRRARLGTRKRLIRTAART